MNDPFQMKAELRYGAPVCDQILTGRFYTVGYSYYFRQAKWTLEIVNPNAREGTRVKRSGAFRADTRIPYRFRAGAAAFRDKTYDRGHLVASGNQNEREVQNSETFLMSNMAPQTPRLNRRLWRMLEQAVRELNARDDILETYVLNCPVFYFDRMIETIGDPHDEQGVDIPVPHAFVKSVLAETHRGSVRLWTFEMPNTADVDGKPEDYLVSTYGAEQRVGGRFWDRIAAEDLHRQKETSNPMW